MFGARGYSVTGSSLASRISRMSVCWLAMKSACRMATCPAAEPCTGSRFRPRRSRTLLRLSAELRRWYNFFQRLLPTGISRAKRTLPSWCARPMLTV